MLWFVVSYNRIWNYYIPQRGLSALSVSTIRASEKASVRGMGKRRIPRFPFCKGQTTNINNTILGFYRFDEDRCTINIHSLDMNLFLAKPYGSPRDITL